MLWILITVIAAALQTARNALQRQLTGRLTPLGAAYTRFLFGLPFAALYAALVFVLTEAVPARPHLVFLVAIAIGAFGQIVATVALIHLFQLRNFSTGVILSKIEIVLAAIFGFVLIGDVLGPWDIGAIGIATGALVLLTKEAPGSGWATLKALAGRPALLGLATGAGFAIAAVAFRAASTSLTGIGFAAAAAETLVATLLLQTIAMGLYIEAREPGQIALVVRAWRQSLLPGLTGALASAGWFTAMTLEAAALVRMLGLVEVPMSYALTHFAFRERPSRREVAGTALLLMAVLVLLWSQIRS